MIDAFSVLGGAPTDSNERLQELLEEKELLTDDASEAQAAYADLTNLKKRLRHEIEYFCRDDFHDFRQMVARAEKPTIVVIADILVGIGRWFEEENDELFEKINDARLVGGYPQIESENVIFAMVEEIKQECISSANSYLDGFVEDSVVKIFNKIVQIGDFESFFIDELMAHYELIVSETLQSKENECTARFDEIESIGNNFNSGASLSPDLSSKVTEFEKALKDWDRYAQPLQKNAQARGGQHENSEKLVHDIRNRTIDLCNRSQEKLGRLIEQLNDLSKFYDFMNNPNAMTARGVRDLDSNRLSAGFNARQELMTKIPDSLRLTEALIQIVNILQMVFSELEITAEQLSKDKEDLIGLKEALIKWNKPLQEEKRKEENRAISAQRTSRNCRITHGVFSAICFIIMIICFAVGNIPVGVGLIVMTIAFGCCCGFYPALEDKGIMKWIIIVAVIAFIAIAGSMSEAMH